MDTYYLVDYENVGNNGISDCSGLSKTDHLVIFYTKNQKKIGLDIVGNHGSAQLEFQKVPVKDQSVDMHLVSYMGYLIGRYENKSLKIIIISKDKDYDNLICFWSGKADIKKMSQIVAVDKKQKSNVKKSSTKSTIKDASRKLVKKPLTINQINHEIKNALSENNYPKTVISDVVTIVSKYRDKKDFKKIVFDELKSDYRMTYDEIYKLIEPTLNRTNG